MIFFLIFSVFANAEYVDSEGKFLFDTMVGCKKYHAQCYKTDKDFDKEYYELKDGEYVKNPQLEQNVKSARKAKEDSVKNQKQEISLLKEKIKTQKLSDEEIKKILIFLLGKLGE